MIDVEEMRRWIGRTDAGRDIVSPGPVIGMSAMLDRRESPEVLPWLWHWFYAMPRVLASEIADDGHTKLGAFLPPSPLPRRMWAGGQVNFLADIPVGATIERRSTVRDITAKSGASGDLVFLVVDHEYIADGVLAVSERQDIVYRGAGAPGAPGPAVPPGSVVRETCMDEVQLFRFSALTYNGHRIHYDRPYTTGVEGYPGLVVHGPLQAVLLVDHAQRWKPGARTGSFNYRARSPLYDGQSFTLNLEPTPEGAKVWTAGPTGAVAMEGVITFG